MLYRASKVMHDGANSDATLVDSVSNAHEILKSVRAANRPNGGESVGLRQYVNITSEVSKLKRERN
jgi:hypothetical protein